MLDYEMLETWEKERSENDMKAVKYRCKVITEIVDLLDKAMLFTRASDTIKVDEEDKSLYETLNYIKDILLPKT